jgi:hypothetical protein
MDDPTGRSGPTPPRYRVDGELTDQKPPKAERRPIVAVESDPADGRLVVVFGAAQHRPAFPLRPLDLDCVKSATLSVDDRAEVVRLVRLVQTDFDPEADPRGWDSVADIVLGAGRPPEQVRQMDYRQLAAFFRVNHHGQTIRLGGAIETNTPSVVSCNAKQSPPPSRTQSGDKPRPKLRPEEHLLLLYERDPKVATLESRALPALAERELGESYTDRTYRGTDLYTAWRNALQQIVSRYGEGWLEGDVLEAGLEIYGSKPGRSDKRRTPDATCDAAARDFFRKVANATVDAKSRRDEGGK